MNSKPAILMLVAGVACHLTGLACLFYAGSQAIASFQAARAEGTEDPSSSLWVLLMIVSVLLFAAGIVLLIFAFRRFWLEDGEPTGSADA